MGSDDNFSVPKAPTKEEMSLSTYTARRKLNRLRRSACQLFTSEAMVKAIRRLELEVESKRLLVRKDRHLWKDIGNVRRISLFQLFNQKVEPSPSASPSRRAAKSSQLAPLVQSAVAADRSRGILVFFCFYLWFSSYKICRSFNAPCPCQTIYGELISLESNNDTLGLAMFILQRLLWNPDIAAEFRHARVPNLYKEGRQNIKCLIMRCDELKKILQ